MLDGWVIDVVGRTAPGSMLAGPGLKLGLRLELGLGLGLYGLLLLLGGSAGDVMEFGGVVPEGLKSTFEGGWVG